MPDIVCNRTVGSIINNIYALYPEKTIIQKDTCIFMLIAALFRIAKTWKQPGCLLTDEYLATKRNEIESIIMRWMNLEPVIQNEVSQKEKNKYHISMHIYGI